LQCSRVRATPEFSGAYDPPEHRARLILTCGDKQADGKSLNQLALLQARHGDRLTLHADGDDAATLAGEVGVVRGPAALGSRYAEPGLHRFLVAVAGIQSASFGDGTHAECAFP